MLQAAPCNSSTKLAAIFYFRFIIQRVSQSIHLAMNTLLCSLFNEC